MARRKRAMRLCPSCETDISVANYDEHIAKCDWKTAREEARSKGVTIRKKRVFKRREKVAVLLVLIMVGVMVAGVEFVELPEAPPGIGDDAPELIWSTGQLAVFLGKVVLINFMDVDCGACQNETSRVHHALYDVWVNEVGNVVFLSVNVRFIGPDNDEADIWEYKAQYDARWQFLNDDDTGKAVRSYGVRNAPTNFVLDRELKIAAIFHGATTYANYNNLFILLNS